MDVRESVDIFSFENSMGVAAIAAGETQVFSVNYQYDLNAFIDVTSVQLGVGINPVEVNLVGKLIGGNVRVYDQGNPIYSNYFKSVLNPNFGKISFFGIDGFCVLPKNRVIAVSVQFYVELTNHGSIVITPATIPLYATFNYKTV